MNPRRWDRRIRRGPITTLVLGAVCAALLALKPQAQAPTPVDVSTWTRTWGAAMATAAPADQTQVTGRQTLRMVIHTSIAGNTSRLHLTNTFNPQPVLIGHVTVARQAKGPTALNPPATALFAGHQEIEIPPGGSADSDALAFPVRADEDLLVSVYLPQAVAQAPFHEYTRATSYATAPSDTADRAAAGDGKSFPATFTHWAYLGGLDVTAQDGAGTVVAIGDSQTDGAHTSLDTNRQWTAFYARALQSGPRPMGVVNAGISGNRLLTDLAGPRAAWGQSVLTRFDRDVLAQPNVKRVIVYAGINDIASGNATGDELAAGIRELARRAHAAHLTLDVATLPPFYGYPGFSAAKEQARQDYNTYLRTTPDIDGCLDFDQATRDPLVPARLFAGYYNRGDDRLHLNDDGAWAVADAVTHATSAHPAPPRFTQTTAADFTGDGVADLVARDPSGRLYLWPGKQDIDNPGHGDGTFADPQPLIRDWNYTQTVAGDFTGDGKADLIAKDADSILYVWPGTGRGTLEDRQRVTGGWNFTQTTAGDFNNDGVCDLIARDADSNLFLWLGRAGGGFAERQFRTGDWDYTQTVAGDFTGDGKADLIAKGADNALHLWPGTGTGDFAPPQKLIGWDSDETTAGTFRGPGLAHLVARDKTTSDLREWTSIGQGRFSHPLLLTGGW
ncbi:FG-GAP-like repeat-containing protein [Streptomyces sp. NPDC006660]|uniref:GDSL-type esterase/lipase family protein n=1 Tax=Streptomyces sp. NPDC006660 TaxID=3156901 RepID=UPI0033F875F5